jgi:hypothetical protein
MSGDLHPVGESEHQLLPVYTHDHHLNPFSKQYDDLSVPANKRQALKPRVATSTGEASIISIKFSYHSACRFTVLFLLILVILDYDIAKLSTWVYSTCIMAMDRSWGLSQHAL